MRHLQKWRDPLIFLHAVDGLAFGLARRDEAAREFEPWPAFLPFARHGEVERAIAELERVTRAFSCYPVFISDAWLDPLRGDARFIRMLRTVEVEHRHAAAAFMDHEGEHVLGSHAS